MAAHQPPQRQPAAPQQPVPFDRFVSVAGARWLEPAGGRQRRRGAPLIPANSEQGQSPHLAGPPSASFQQPRPGEQLTQLDPKAVVISFPGPATGVQHYIPARRHRQRPHRLAQAPLQPVPRHRIPYRAARSEAEPAQRPVCPQGAHHQQVAPIRPAAAVDGAEVSPLTQTLCSPHGAAAGAAETIYTVSRFRPFRRRA